MNASEIAALLDMSPHPEGGWYKETWRCDEEFVRADGNRRSAGTAIYYLLSEGTISAWHRVASAEIWHFYDGSPLTLQFRDEDGIITESILGTELLSGARPQIIIPAGVWQRAICAAEGWTLVGCTVSPGFDFADFEME